MRFTVRLLVKEWPRSYSNHLRACQDRMAAQVLSFGSLAGALDVLPDRATDRRVPRCAIGLFCRESVTRATRIGRNRGDQAVSLGRDPANPRRTRLSALGCGERTNSAEFTYRLHVWRALPRRFSRFARRSPTNFSQGSAADRNASVFGDCQPKTCLINVRLASRREANRGDPRAAKTHGLQDPTVARELITHQRIR